MADQLWVFGYGSLIWRPSFRFDERVRGHLRGWARRFAQKSPDHRGTPGAPGRVATLIADEQASCLGVAYRVVAGEHRAVLASLDRREAAGYERHVEAVELDGGRSVEALFYVAAPGNPYFVAGETLAEVAAVVRRCRGPSGANAEYVHRLDRALEALGEIDPHVRSLAELVGAEGPWP